VKTIKKMNKIWLSSPHMGGTEQKYIQEAFDENWIAPLGPNVTHFETALATYQGVGVRVAALSSGTAALHLSLILAGVKADDEVICQSMTFSASANPIAYLGATPVFIDSEYTTWNLCPIALEAAIVDRIRLGKKPKAIIGVHLYGMPFQVDEIQEIAKKYEITLIEDGAESLGSTYKNQKCGTFGDFGVLSFNGNKIITTSGGGALITKSDAMKDKAVFLATQARDQAPHYQHSEIGYNYRMSNISAGIGRGQMEVIANRVLQRRAMHQFYQDIFKDSKKVQVFSEPTSDYYSNFWLSTLLTDSYETRETIRLALEEQNIEARPLWKPMHLQPVFAGTSFYGTQVAEDLFNRGLCLPSGSNLTDEERNRIQRVLVRFV
jgi:dTDP-4-amino-4,6-dideoxygalactose transaminase